MSNSYSIINNWKGTQLKNESSLAPLAYTVSYKEDCNSNTYELIATSELAPSASIEIATKGDGYYKVVNTSEECTDSCLCERTFSSFSGILQVLVPKLAQTICADDCSGCNDFLDDQSTMGNLVKLHTFFNFSTCAYARSGRIIANLYNCTMLAMLDSVKCESQFTGKEEWAELIDNITSLQYLALYLTDRGRVTSDEDIAAVDSFYNIAKVTKCLSAKGMNVTKISEEFNTLTATCMEGNCTDEFANWVADNVELFNTIVGNYITGNPDMLLSVLNRYIGIGGEDVNTFIEEILKQILSQAENINSDIYKIFSDILSEYYSSENTANIENLLNSILESIIKEINDTTINGNGPVTTLFEEIIKQVLGNNDTLLCEFITNCTTAGGALGGFLIIPGMETVVNSCNITGTFVVRGSVGSTQIVQFTKEGEALVILNIDGTNSVINTSGTQITLEIPASGEALVTYTMSNQGLPVTELTHLNYSTISGQEVSIATLLCQDCNGTPANNPPVAGFTVNPNAGTSDTIYTFDASNSSDSDGTIVQYSWNFGDGGTASGITTTHNYAAAGTYVVTLTVTDNLGATHSTTKTIVVNAVSTANNPPAVSITYADGTIASKTCSSEPCDFSFIATGTDPDNDALSYVWEYGTVVGGVVNTWTTVSGTTSTLFNLNIDSNRTVRVRCTVSDGLSSSVISNTIDSINSTPNIVSSTTYVEGDDNLCNSCAKYTIRVASGDQKQIKFVKSGFASYTSDDMIPSCYTAGVTTMVETDETIILSEGKYSYSFGLDAVSNLPTNNLSTTITVTVTDINSGQVENTEILSRAHVATVC